MVNFEIERFNQMIKATKRTLTAEETLYALDHAIEVQRKLDITKAIAEEGAGDGK